MTYIAQATETCDFYKPTKCTKWYKDSKHTILHRTDGPAAVYEDGAEAWYVNGLRHCIDGPACIYPNGDKFWYQWSQLHREGGPAIVFGDDNTEHWYFRDKLHRLDGPATYGPHEPSRFYVNGVHYHHPDKYALAVAYWLSYQEVTREEIKQQIGQFRIVEWE